MKHFNTYSLKTQSNPLCAVSCFCFKRLQRISTWLGLQLIDALCPWPDLCFSDILGQLISKSPFGRPLFPFPWGVHVRATLSSEFERICWTWQTIASVLFGWFVYNNICVAINCCSRKYKVKCYGFMNINIVC